LTIPWVTKYIFWEGHRQSMDPGVRRIVNWWGTLVLGLGLVTVGVGGYLWVVEELEWYRTDVSGASEVQGKALGEYVRVDGTVALNASRDVIITQEEVEKAVWTVHEYEYHVDWVWVEDDDGGVVLVLFDHVRLTKPGRHGGDYHKGDRVCIGGTVATESGVGIKRVRADLTAKHPVDSNARYVAFFYAFAFVGMMLVLVFVLARFLLNPRKTEAPDWRGT
jgi:hypothetical protein